MLTAHLLSWAVRGSLLLFAGWLVARAMESRSATVAHRVLVSAVACTLILPLVTALGPSWYWKKPAWMAAGGEPVEDSASPAETPQPTSPPVDDPIEIAAAGPQPSALEPVLEESPAVEESSNAPTETAAPVASEPPVSVRADSAPRIAGMPTQSPWTVAEYITAMWAIVALLLLARVTYSIAALRRFLRRQQTAPETVSRLVEAAARRIGWTGTIHVLLSDDGVMPMACWLGRWTIVLPAGFPSWPDELQETTLLHELGHIVRRDAWADYLVQVACCLLWLTPLSWLAAREVRRLRERACDEWTLQKSSMNARTYAECLLEVVRRCQPRRLQFVSAMAGKKDFESRLRWLASVSRPMTTKPITSAMIVLGMAAIGIAVATAEPTDAPPSSEQPASSDPRDGVTAAETPVVIVTRDPAPPSPAISVGGVVRDLAGNPLSGTQVVLRAKVATGHQYAPAIDHDRDVLARTESDAEGRFAFSKIGIPPRMIHVLQNLREGNVGAQLVVWGEGKGVVWEPISSFEPPEMKIHLAPQADVSGVVTDEDGKPLDDVELRVSGLMRGTDNFSGVMNDPGDLRLFRSEIQFRTRSQDGRFSLPNMPRDIRVFVRCRGRTGQIAGVLVDTGHGTTDYVRFRNPDRKQIPVHRTPINAALSQHPWVRIRVVDQDGNPVSSGSVEAVNQNGFYGGDAEVGDDGIAILAVNNPGVHEVYYGSDPLKPAVGVAQSIDIKTGGSPEVELKLPATRLLIGRVIDGDTGAPVVGAYVYCARSADDGKMPRPTSSLVVSDRNGVFKAPVTNGVWLLRIRHNIDGYFAPSFLAARGNAKRPETIEVKVEPGKVPRRAIFKVARGLAVEGFVVDADGKPQAALPVRAESMDAPYRKASAVTDADGRFRLNGFSPYVETRVWTWAPGGTAEQTIAPSPDQPWETTLTKTITLQLAPGTTLTGRVIRDGKPVPGVHVKLHKAPPQPPGQNWTKFSIISEATTDENGRYRVTGLHKGDQYQVEIEPTGNAEVRDWRYQSPFSQTLQGEGPEAIELPDAKLVSSGKELSGIVVDPDGNPLAGITVSASLASGGMLSRPQNGPPPWTKSDENGRFRITNLPEEAIELMAYKAGPGGSAIRYPSHLKVKMNAADIRIVLDPKLGSGIEDLDAN